MDQIFFSRIDRAVADNIKDIERSFGSQAGLVQDFIVFISKKLKTDLFGFTRFTIQEFCQETGRMRQELSLVHPDFVSGKIKPPVIQGYEFNTVLDFALYTMLEKNIIFSKVYEVKAKEKTISMHSFPILKDLKLNFDRRSKEKKIYEIRISDELLGGFLTRYYTLSSESYRLVGKGRGGESRKKLLIYLSKLSHVILTTESNCQTLIPVERLCQFGDIKDRKPSHKKQNLSRMLEYIRSKGSFSFDYEFVTNGFNFEYFVKLTFSRVDKRVLIKEHGFYYKLLSTLKAVFDSRKDRAHLPEDTDQFQAWIVRANVDTSLKAQALIQAYYHAFQINLSQSYAIDLILSSRFVELIKNVK